MFGTSGAKDVPGGVGTIANMGKRASVSDSESGGENADSSSTRKGSNEPRRHSVAPESTANKEEKRRRGSGVGSFLQNARNSLHLNNNHAKETEKTPESPLQRLSRDDPALGVPQGPNNNSAGESLPTARSTFLVGVAEDKNKKCRRTMEDTHAYLYNFLATPAPAVPDTSSASASPRSSESETRQRKPAHVMETDNGYFAIFDGHAGAFAADWCGKKMHVLLEENIRGNPNSTIPELLDRSFTSADQQLDKLPLKNSGCTAVCAVLRWEDRVPSSNSATGSTSIAPATAAAVAAKTHPEGELGDEKKPHPLPVPSPSASPPPTTPQALQQLSKRSRVLYTANVGDARCVLCRSGKALRLSYDHKGSDEHEGKRIASAGGLILNNRVNGVLAVTRALGDAYLKDLVTGHPYTTETVIQSENDEFMILACDGLWDVCTDQEAVDLIRNQKDPQKAAKALVDFALARFSTDNLSCMVVRFDRDALKKTVEQVLEPIGVEGDQVATTGEVSETQAIVEDARRKLGQDGPPVHAFEKPDGVPDSIREEEGEAGPELKLPT